MMVMVIAMVMMRVVMVVMKMTVPLSRFGRHIDESNYDSRHKAYTLCTLLLYLNGAAVIHADGGSSPQKVGRKGNEDEYTQSQAAPGNGALDTTTVGTSPSVDGGDTVFYKGSLGLKEAARVSPRVGMALLHVHGEDCLLHEGAAVRAGVKYLLRTDIIFRAR